MNKKYVTSSSIKKSLAQFESSNCRRFCLQQSFMGPIQLKSTSIFLPAQIHQIHWTHRLLGMSIVETNTFESERVDLISINRTSKSRSSSFPAGHSLWPCLSYATTPFTRFHPQFLHERSRYDLRLALSKTKCIPLKKNKRLWEHLILLSHHSRFIPFAYSFVRVRNLHRESAIHPPCKHLQSNCHYKCHHPPVSVYSPPQPDKHNAEQHKSICSNIPMLSIHSGHSIHIFRIYQECFFPWTCGEPASVFVYPRALQEKCVSG